MNSASSSALYKFNFFRGESYIFFMPRTILGSSAYVALVDIQWVYLVLKSLMVLFSSLKGLKKEKKINLLSLNYMLYMGRNDLLAKFTLSCAQICPTVCVQFCNEWCCHGAIATDYLCICLACAFKIVLFCLKYMFFSLLQCARIHPTKLKNPGMLVSFYQLRFTSKTRYGITYFSVKKNHVEVSFFKDLQFNL